MAESTLRSPGLSDMHGKYAVISLLLAGLALLVFGLMRLESRRTRVSVIRITEPALVPLTISVSRESIETAARQARAAFRCRGDEFEYLTLTTDLHGTRQEKWEKLFVIGANLGVALPGRYPTEFVAQPEDYARWLKQMGDAGVNVVRVYTILPPEFYQALADYNFKHSARPVFLLQGIWAELPDSNNLFDAPYTEALKREIRNAVDVVAGRAVLAERAGHASGVFPADVSPFTLGYLIGREWEPPAVLITDTCNPTVRRYDGVFFNVVCGQPTEVWLAGMMDFLVQYEVTTYGVQHPVSFVSWLPVDPMFHSSEYSEGGDVREYDNDLARIRPRSIQTTPLMRAGYYAAYHVYPYYPDFIFLEPAYRDYRNRRGEPDNYAGYLNDLKRHHAGMPLLIAEFGVPSSRGNSHHNRLGIDHGGHSEDDQARLNLRMLRAIHDEACAGGIVFAWLDEWFKRNWLIDQFSVPAERTRLWHNVQNPEQCYGMVKFGRELVTVDGETDDWTGRPLIQAGAAAGGQGIRAVWAAADEAYCYIRLDLYQAPDWSRDDICLAIDTYGADLGNRRIAGYGLDCANGTEFLVVLADTNQAEVLVDSTYSIFTGPVGTPQPKFRTSDNRDGRFISERLLSNRPRTAADGEAIPGYATEYGKLRFGRSAENSLADWYVGDSVIELRLPWGLLNVTDPSSFQVLQDDTLVPGIQSAKTPGFAFAAFIPSEGSAGIAAALPSARGNTLQFTRRWRWAGWELPDYTERLKSGYQLLAAGLPDVLAGSTPRRVNLNRLTVTAVSRDRPVSARIAQFRDDARGAISLTLDDGSYDQFTRALPVLNLYELKANFGLVADWTDAQSSEHAEEDGLMMRRLGISEAKQLLTAGHVISAHGKAHSSGLPAQGLARMMDDFRAAREDLGRALDTPVRTFHYPYSTVRPAVVEAVRRTGYWFGRTSDDRYNLPGEFDRFRLSSFAHYSDTQPGLKELVRILDAGAGKWTVILHHHILESRSREMQTMAQHNVINTYAVTPQTFGRQMRLVRNAGAWVAPLEDVGRYLLQYRSARLSMQQTERSATLKILGAEQSGLPVVPMTVVVSLPWRWVRVSGSACDGVYSPYQGLLNVQAVPGQEVLLDDLGGGR